MQNRSNQKYSYSSHPLFPSDKWAGLSKQGVELEGPGKRICYKKENRRGGLKIFCVSVCLKQIPFSSQIKSESVHEERIQKGNILKYRGGLSLIHPARCSRYTVLLSLFHCSVTAMKECYFWVTELCFSLASVTPLRLIISSELQISTDPAKHLSTCSTLRTYCVLGGFPQCELNAHFAGWTALYHNYITSGREPYSFPKGLLLSTISV